MFPGQPERAFFVYYQKKTNIFVFPPFPGGMKYAAYVRIYLSIVLSTLILLAACSQKKNTVVTRGYHNLTSRYNGYFYSKESMKEGLSKLADSYEDDYTQILPLFRIPNSSATKGCYPDMEKSIKKSSTLIERHAITDRGGTEIAGAVKWIDENYVLIGRARYYKGEYLSALQTFEYVSRKYEKDPVRFTGYLWQAKTHLELGGISQAMPLLDLIDNDKECPEELKPQIKATYADLYIREGNFGPAIKALKEAVELTKNKKEKARFTYVLGQLYQKTGKTKEATECFAKVVDMHPDYIMLFNAKINRSRMSGAESGKREEARKELNKLLKDPKNKEYYDQIYFSLGEIEQRAKNEDLALKYYKTSTAVSMGNINQKALSYLAAADIYFSRVDYPNAQLYYDSTMMILPKGFEGYTAIDDKRKSLNNLVKYLKIVKLEDSLQQVVETYGDDTTKLYPYIDKLIQIQKDRDKKLQEQRENGTSSGQGGNFVNFQGGGGTTTSGGAQGGGSWYWYNPSNVSYGVNEFAKRWGTRKLEDNWRRANKETILENGDGGDGGDTAKVAGPDKGKPADNKTRQYYIKNLPFSKEAQDKSNEKVADAYYNLGSIYKEQLRNNGRSIESFDKLTVRYPKHKYSLPSHYQLYRLYLAEKNQPKADAERDYIMKNFPESEYAQIIKNPNYEVNVNADRERVTAYYGETFLLYKAGNYAEVITRCEKSESEFGNNPYASRFDYLKALSLGRTQGQDALTKALTQIIIKHPKDAVKDEAQALLDRIKGKASTIPQDSGAGNASFKVTEVTEYQYIVIIENGKGNLNKFRSALSDYNAQSYGSANLAVTSLMLDTKNQLVMVKGFASRSLGVDYHNLLKGNVKVFNDLQPGSYQAFAISTENFAILFKDKDVDAYKKFFEQQVIKKTP